jgi:hypothetical protein
MPVWIVAHSEALCNFLLPLLVELTGPQQRHALNVVAALLVCTRLKHRTLAALTRVLRVPHADQFACADFFRCSAWSAAQVQQALMRFLLQTVVRIQQVTGWRLLFLSVDDALAPKDVATTALEAVTFHHDHVEQRQQKKQYTNASRYVTVHLQLGSVQLALAWRLYLSRKQVQRLNRTRRAADQPLLTYHSLVELVEEMLAEIAPHLPTAGRVYVLFDSWYDGRHLEHFIHDHGWQWICATKSNRVVHNRPLCQWWTHLGQQRITPVVVCSATRSRTYATRRVVGRLRRYPEPVVAIISKRARRDSHPAYFLCSDTTLSVQTILKYSGCRWQAEVDNWYLKERFGLADYRLQSYEAILRWHTLVFAAYAFVQYRRVRPLLTNPKATLTELPEVLAAHQHEHLRQTVCYIAALARRGLSDAKILADLLPT